MIVGEISDIGTLGRGGRHGGGRRHHGGRGRGRGWWGGYGPGWWGPDYITEVIPPADKFVLVNPEGKGTVVVSQIPGDLPPKWTFRRATTAEAALNKALSGVGMGQWAELVSTAVKVGTDVYAKKQEARAKKKAEAEQRRQAALEQARAQQQALIYSGGGSGFPWMTVGIAGVGVVTLGTIAYLLLRKK